MQSLRQFGDEFPIEENTYFEFDSPYWQDWLKYEGLEHITDHVEDSYGFTEHYPYMINNYQYRKDYWYWSKCLGTYIFRIYVFRNCILVDKDWDCGGNAGGRCFDIDMFSIDFIWDEIMEYIKGNID